MGYLFPDRTDDLYDSDDEPEREPSDEEILEEWEARLASREWLDGPGAVVSRLTGVSRAAALRARAEALRAEVFPDECPLCCRPWSEGDEHGHGACVDDEHEARESDQAAADMHFDAALAAERK